MKLTLPSAFRKTKNSAPAESQDALPQYSLGFRAMALLTASVIFFQTPVSLLAATWNPFVEIENAQTLATKLSLIGGGSFSNTGVGSHWVGNPPSANETAEFRLFSQDYLVLIDRPSAVGGILTTLGGGAAGSTVAIGSSTATASLTLGSTGIGVDAGNLRLESGLSVIFGASQTWSPAVGTVLDVRSTLSGGSANYSLTKQGPGQLILSGNNTFAGGVSLDGGVLVLNGSGTSSTNSAIGTGLLTINGGSLDNTSIGTVALATNNNQAWNGDFTYLGTSGRVLNVGTGAVTLGENRTVTVAAGEFAVGGVIGGTYSLTKAGAGVLTLAGANTYSGGLTLSEGQTNLNNASAAGSGTLTINGGSIDNTSSGLVTLAGNSQIWGSGFTFVGTKALNTGTGAITLSTGTTLTIQGSVFTIGGSLSGNASITKAGAGKLQLEAAATYAGSTRVTSGTLSTNAANILPASTDVTIDAGARVELGGAQTFESLNGAGNLAKLGALTLSNGSGNSFSGVLSGSGDVTLVTGTLTLGGTNTYTGITTLNSGATLKIANSAALGNSADSTSISSGATLDLNGQTNVAESFDVRGTGNGGAGALINSADAAATVGGVVKLWANSTIGGSGNITLSGGVTEDTQRNLTKVGAGVLTLEGASTFTGSTDVAEGILKLANPNALGDGTSNTSGVSVTSGAALDLNGLNPAAVPLTLNGDGASSAGALFNASLAPAEYAGDVTLGSATSIGGGIKLTGNIVGAQSLTKVGTGLLVLEGATNAASSISISDGIVRVGNGATSGTLGAATVSVASGAGLVFKRVDDYAGPVNNVISGSGSVTVESGTLTLGGANTYTGPTRLLTGSTLLLGSSGALGSSSEALIETGGRLDLNGNGTTVNLKLDGSSISNAVLVNSGATTSLSSSLELISQSAIGGTGDIQLSGNILGADLIKVGANTLELSGTNSYGQTIISDGTLRIAAGGNLGTGEIQNNARLAFGRADSTNLANTISGSGVVFVEAGTLSLTGANTYTGATTVLTGATLSIGTGGTEGSVVGNIDLGNASFVNFDRSNEAVYGGSLSGAGTFAKLGTGTLGLFNDATDLTAGNILVSQGVLSIGTGGATGAIAGNITNNASVQFNRTGVLSYNEVISGAGSVSNVGTGQVTLAGNQTYQGETNVTAGSLTVGVLSATRAVEVSGAGSLTAQSFNSTAPLNISDTGTVTVSGTGLSFDLLKNNSAATTGLSFTGVSGTITVGGLSGVGTTSFASNADISGPISRGTVTVAGLLTADDIDGGTLSAQSLTTSGDISGGGITLSNGAATLARVSGGNLTLGGATNSVDELLGGTFNFTDATASLTVAGGVQNSLGVIGGTVRLTSTGDLTLAGENTYTRGTVLSSGTLTVGRNSALGTGTLTVTSGGSLAASVADLTIVNQISLGGTLTFLGTNSLTAQGSLVLSADSALNVTAQHLALGGSIVAGASVLSKEGGGTLELAGAGALSDVALTINAGSVTARVDALGASASVTTGALGTLSLLGNQSINSVNGSGSLLLGSSSLTLANGGNYSGAISGQQGSFLNLSGGTLTVSAIGQGFEGTLAVNGGVVDLAGNTQRVGDAVLNGGTIQNGTLNFNNLVLSRGSYNAQLSGFGELKKDSAPGTVSLGADNSSFNGSAVIEGGTLSLEHANALTSSVSVSFKPTGDAATLRVGTPNVSLNSIESIGSQSVVALETNTLTLNTTNLREFRGSITSSAGGSLVIAGEGTQVLSGDSTGAVFRTEIRSGVLEIGHERALGDSVNEVALSGGNLTLNTAGVLAARHNLTSTGNSTLTLRGSLNQTLGDLSLAGTLSVIGGVADAVQNIAFEGTTLVNASTLTVDTYASVSVGAIDGNHDLTKSGNGLLTLTGANTSTGATTVNGGSLILASGGSLASGNLTVDGSGVVLDLGATSQTVAAVSVNSATVQTGTLSGASFSLSGATVSAKLIGSGALTSSGATTLSGQNTYSGDTTVSDGSLTIAATGSLNTSGNVIVNQGAFANFLGTNVTIGSVSGAGTTAFNGNATIAADLTGGVVNIAGDASLAAITGGAVTVGGAATADLSGGSLTLNGSGSMLRTVSGGSLTLVADKTATVATLTDGNVSTAGTLQADAGTFIGTLGGTGSFGVSNANSVTLNGTLTAFTGAYVVDGIGSTLAIGTATSSNASLALVSGGSANLNYDGTTLGRVANDGRLALATGTITLGTLSGNGIVSASGQSSLKVGFLGEFGEPPVFSGSLTGGISLIKEGQSAAVLSGNSDFQGSTTVSEGLLVVRSSGALSTGSIAVMSGASLGLEQGSTLSNSILLDGTSGYNMQAARLSSFQGENGISGTLSFAGRADIDVIGGSLLTSSISAVQGSQAPRLRIMGNSNSSVTVGGTIALGHQGTLEADMVNLTLLQSVTGSEVQIARGVATLHADINANLNLLSDATANLANNLSVSSLSSQQGTTLDLGINGLTINEGQDRTAYGAIIGSGSLTLGSGSLTLAGSNSYTGGTTVTDGFLDVTGSLASERALTINGGTVRFTNGAVLGAVANNGRLVFGSTGTMTSLSGNGVTEFAGGVTLGDVTGGTLTIATVNPSAVNTVGALSGVDLTVRPQTKVTAASFAGSTATVDGVLEITGAVTGGQITNRGQIEVGTLTAGDFTTTITSVLTAQTGTFTGSILGDGQVRTTGALRITEAAGLSETLRHLVAPAGSLTFDGSRTVGTLENEGRVSFVGSGTVDFLRGPGETHFQSDARLGIVDGGQVTVDGIATLATLNGGSLIANGSLSGTSINGGELNLRANDNTLGTVSDGVLFVAGSTTISTLQGGAVTNGSLLTVTTLNGGNIVNNSELRASGGNFAGSLSGNGALAVDGSLTLGGALGGYTGAVSVNNAALLTVASEMQAENVVSVSSLASARFDRTASLQSLTNAGSVRFTDATIGALTGTGRTTFTGRATLTAGISQGIVDIAGVSRIGAVTGGELTLRSDDNVLDAINASARVNILASADVTTLSAGTITNSGFLNVTNGNFSGSILGDGQVRTEGVLRIAETAGLSETLRHSVAPAGSLTFEGSRTVGTLENQGRVSFVGSGAVDFLRGLGETHFQSDARLGIVDGGQVTVDGIATLTTLEGGSLIANGSLSGTSINGGELNLGANSNTLGTVSNGLLFVNGSTTISTLQGGAVTNGSLLTVTTLNGGNIVNNAELRASGGNFAGSLSGNGALAVNGSLTLGGALGGYTGAVSVNNAALLTVASGMQAQNAVSVSSLASARFESTASLQSLTNAGSVRFTDATIGALTGNGRTTFTGRATLTGGISQGIVDIDGVSRIGAVTGGELTLRSDDNVLDAINGSARVNILARADVTTLSAGTITNSGLLNVTNGNFSGSILGDGEVRTQGVLRIAETAGLSETLRHSVAPAGSLTFEGSRSVGTLENQGRVSFVGSGAVDFLRGLGETHFQSDARLGIVDGGQVTVDGIATLTTLEGGRLIANGSLSGTSMNGGELNLKANNNTLGTVSNGLLFIDGSTTISTLQGGAVTNGSLLTVTTLNGGNIVNNAELRASGGNFAGSLSGTGALAVDGSLTLGGVISNYTGSVSVNNAALLTVASEMLRQNAVSVSSLASASFDRTASLQSLTNAGSVRFTDATIASLIGNGRTTFTGDATLIGGISVGVVDISGASRIGAVTGGELTLRSNDNVLGAINGTAQINILGSARAETLTSGIVNVTNPAVFQIDTGSFSGSLLGNGSVRTNGVFTVNTDATLAESLRHEVTSVGELTFQGTRNIDVLENNGIVTFNGGALNKQTGTGTVKVASGILRVANGAGSLEVNKDAAAVYSQPVSLSSVENSGSLSFSAGSSVQQITSSGTLAHSGNLTINGGGDILSLSGGSTTSITKSGAGTLTLGGSYSGGAFVEQGTLSLGNGGRLSGNVEVKGGRLLLGGTNQLTGNLTLTLGVIDLAGYAQLTVGTFTTSGGILGSEGETAKLAADRLDITGGKQNAVTLLRGSGAQSFTGTVTMPQIGEAGSKNSVELNGVGASVSAGNIFAPSVTLGGSSNLLVVSGSSAVALRETAVISIGGTQNTLEFQQGFAPQQALALVVGDAGSEGGTLRVGGAGLVLGGSQTLMGKGTVDGNVRLGSGATFAPGNSPGKFTVTGSLAITSGASTVFEYTAEKQVAVGGGSLDQLVVGTLASLGGSVSAIAVGGTVGAGGVFQPSGISRVNNLGTTAVPVITYASGPAPAHLPSVTSYVTVGGGTYRSAVVTADLTAPSTVSGGTVYLNVTRNAFASFATGNVSATGQLLDRALQVNNPAVSALIDDLDIQASAAGVQSRLAALDPGVYADLGNIGLDRLRDIQSGLANHIDMLALDSVGDSSLSLAVKPGQSAAAAAVEQSRAWTTAYGGWGRRNSDLSIGSAGYSSTHFGDISGVETKMGGLTLGLLGAFGGSTATFENGRGKVTSDSWHTGVYGNFAAGALVLDASIAYGQSESTLKRNVNVLGGGATTGKSQGTEWSGQVGVAVPFRSESGSLMITPSLHLIHASVKQDGLTESSLNGLEAVVNGRTTEATSVRTGVQAAKITKLANKTTRFTASLDWLHSFQSDPSDVEIALQGAGSTTSRFQGSRSGRDAVRIGLGAEMALTERTRIRLNVDEQIRSGMKSTYGSASFGLQF